MRGPSSHVPCLPGPKASPSLLSFPSGVSLSLSLSPSLLSLPLPSLPLPSSPLPSSPLLFSPLLSPPLLSSVLSSPPPLPPADSYTIGTTCFTSSTNTRGVQKSCTCSGKLFQLPGHSALTWEKPLRYLCLTRLLRINWGQIKWMAKRQVLCKP